MLNAQKTNKNFVIIAKKFDIIAKILENPIKSRYTKSVAKLHGPPGTGIPLALRAEMSMLRSIRYI